ncbi:hypothetical protein GY12_25255 [Micrococcus luteus]|nr:hypothetical protein GY12_27375 [Micrococcus luteus]KFC49762.1 hypothetical protein GY12_25255 [Micrococcus luteus]
MSAFVGFVGALLWRLIAHAVGWGEYTMGESLAFATFMGCFWGLICLFSNRRADRAEADTPSGT